MWEHHAWDAPIRVGGRAFAEKFLESGWNVAWLNGPLAPWNLMGGPDEVRRRRANWRLGGESRVVGSGRLFAYAPMSVIPYRPYPVLDRPWFHRRSIELTLPPLGRTLEREGFAEVDLLWLATGSPFLALLDRKRHRKSLYRLSDDTLSFPDTPRSYGSLEEEVLRRVDRVIATAGSLAERARRFNSRVLLLPNGVDLRRFTRSQAGTFRSPREGRPPRLVYVGAIDSWLDTALVTALSRALPGTEIHLAGPSRIGFSWAKGTPGVRWKGTVPPEEVPEILAESDVGIIPFRDTPLTRAIHPVKLYEYFAAGLPVVATDLEEIRRIGSPALLARNVSEWVDAIRTVLNTGRRPEYPAFAARHDWSRRFADLLSFLEEPAGLARRSLREGAR
jgi:glycosyltransferase involved in cell wall biosynthesis